MERFYKKLKKETPSSPSSPSETALATPSLNECTSPSLALPLDPHLHTSSRPIPRVSHSAQAPTEFDINSLESDPGLRVNIMDYPPNKRDEVRRAYILRKACQPILKEFPQRKFGEEMRRFNPSWYKMYPSWLEYSENKDAVFCLCCYLFKNETGRAAGGNAFVIGGFYGWNKVERCAKHVGLVNSAHNEASRKCGILMNVKQSLPTIVQMQSDKERRDNRIRLTASIDTMRFLLQQGLAFRGHDESKESANRGNFLELLIWYAVRKDDVDACVLENAPGNNQLIAPIIQQDIAKAFAKETTKRILEDLGDECFSILVDESSDISHKEQVAICIRYVDKSGRIIERFIGLVHVTSTCAISLKNATFSLLLEHSLSPSRIRGQGYDGASNMKGEINGLKTLILKESSSAYYVHCFAHQLQLTLVAVSLKNEDCTWLFEQLANLLNVIGSSCKRMEMLREKQLEEVAKALDVGELQSGSGLNQELGLSRPGDTRWGSHYKILTRVHALFSSICSVLGTLGDTCLNVIDRTRAQTMMYQLESFHFVFLAQLMMNIFGITNELNLTLQRKDQDIVNAMSLVALAKEKLQKMRDGGWESFLSRVCAFCVKHNIVIPHMDDDYVPWGRKNRRKEKVSYLHHFRVEVFLKVIDQQLQELNNRFNEVNTELLLCMACLSTKNSFAYFDKQKLLRLAQFYPNEFPSIDYAALEYQLKNYIDDMRRDERFYGLKDLGELSVKLVDTEKHLVFAQVYSLLKLVMILPVATASVERVFSAMAYVKNKVRNSLGDVLLNDCLVTYIERDVSSKISTDVIISRFQNMKSRRGQV